MDEYMTIYQACGGLLAAVFACLLYGLGGRSGKWKRRFIGSFVLACAVNIISALRGLWSPWLLLAYPALTGGFSMGYGGDDFGAKLIRRGIYALTVCSSGLIFCLVFGGNAWWILIPHVGIGLWSIFLGVKNPIYAAAEEVFICMILNIGLLMYPFLVVR